MKKPSIMQYIFQPEDSTYGLAQSMDATLSRRTIKTMFWVGMSFLLSVGISQLN